MNSHSSHEHVLNFSSSSYRGNVDNLIQSDSQIEMKLKSELDETLFPDNNFDEKMPLAIKNECLDFKSEHPDVKPEYIPIENMESQKEVKHCKKRKCNKQAKNHFACLQRLLLTTKCYKTYKKQIQQSGEDVDDCLGSDTPQSIESCTLCIRNFPNSWTYEQIKHYLAKECGSVESTSILDGTVVVIFEDSEKCKIAMQNLHDKEVEGEKLVAEIFADNKDDSESEADSEASLPTKKRKLETTSQGPSINSCESDFEELYGLKHEYLRSLGITPPLHKWISVSGFICDKAELRDIFELAGTVLFCHVIVSESSKYARIMYAHPLEAVQAVSMLNGQNCSGEELTVTMTMPPESDLYPGSLTAMGPGLGINGQPLKDIVRHYEKYAAGKKSLVNDDLFLSAKFKNNVQNSAVDEIAERDVIKEFSKIGISTKQLLELLELVASRHKGTILNAENIESENSEKEIAVSNQIRLQNQSKSSPTTSFLNVKKFQVEESLNEQSVGAENSDKYGKLDPAQKQQTSIPVSMHSNVAPTAFGNLKWDTLGHTSANGSSLSGHGSDRCGSMFGPGNNQNNPSQGFQNTIFGPGNHVTGSAASMSGSGYMGGSSGFVSGPSNSMPSSNNIMPGPSGFMHGPSGSMHGSTGPMYGTTGPMHGQRGSISGPNCPMPGPSGPMPGPSGPMPGPSGHMPGPSGPRHGPVGPMVGVSGPMSGANGPVLGPSGPMPRPVGHNSAPGGHILGTNTPMYGSSGHPSGPNGTIAGPSGHMVGQGVSMPGPGYINVKRDVYPGQVLPTQGSSMPGATGHMVRPMQSGFMQNPPGPVHDSRGNVGPMVNPRAPVFPRSNHSGPNPYMYTPNSGNPGPRPGFTPIKMMKGAEPVTIIISNMPKTASFSELLEKFSQFGEVTSLQFVAPNSATVKYTHPSMADRCLDDFNKTYRDGSIADKPVN